MLFSAPLASAQRSDEYLQKVRTFLTASEFRQQTAGKVTFVRVLDPARHAALLRDAPALPVREITVIAGDASATWVGTSRGVIRLSDNYRRREYFAGMRWLDRKSVV